MIIGWIDPKLSWTPADNNNVSKIFLPASDVWTPTLYVNNGLTDTLAIKIDPTQTVTVQSDGGVNIMITKKITVSCTLDLTDFPYDSHNCSIHVIFTDNKVTFIPSYNVVDSTSYSQTGEFQLTGSYIYAKRQGLCSTVGDFCYPMYTVTLAYMRLSTYYVMNVIVPACLLSSELLKLDTFISFYSI